MDNKTKKLTTLAMLCAIAYAAVAAVRIPVVEFLKYEPKDVIIAIGGFLFGPMSSVLISGVVSLIEMVTLSETGFIGLVMNILSSASFAAVAAAVYRKKKSIGSAAAGLVLGTAAMTAVMLLWNYFVTPIYMGYPRAAVAKMLVPVFLPFNLLKGGLNSALTMLIYKPVVTALRKTGLVPESKSASGKINAAVVLVSAFAVASLIFCMLIIKGII